MTEDAMDALRVRIAAQITPHLYYHYSKWEDANETDREEALEIATEIINELDLHEELPDPGEGDRLHRYVTCWEQR